MAAGQGFRGGGWQKKPKRRTRRLLREGGAYLVDAIGVREDPGGVGESGCWLRGAGEWRACGVEARLKALVGVHKYPTNQVPTTLTRLFAGERVVGPVADAPDEVIRAGLSDVRLASCHERSL